MKYLESVFGGDDKCPLFEKYHYSNYEYWSKVIQPTTAFFYSSFVNYRNNLDVRRTI